MCSLPRVVNIPEINANIDSMEEDQVPKADEIPVLLSLGKSVVLMSAVIVMSGFNWPK